MSNEIDYSSRLSSAQAIPLPADDKAFTYTLFEQAADGMFIADSSGRLLAANREACRISGFTHDEVLQRTIADFAEASEVPRLREALQKVFQGGQVGPMDWHAIRKNGMPIVVEINAKYLPEGRLLAIVRDVTLRRKIEAINAFFLKLSKDLLETTDGQKVLQRVAENVVPELADGCLIFLQHGKELIPRAIAHSDPNKVIIFRQMLERYPPTINDHLEGYSISIEQPRLIKIVDENYLKQLSIDLEHFSILKSLKITSYLSIPLIARKKPIGLLSLVMCESGRHYDQESFEILSPLTERVSLVLDNASLLQEAVQAAQLRENVISVVAHDLRSPISIVKSSCEAILELIHKQELSEVETFSEIAIRNLDRCLTLISDLLDLSKLASGSFVIEMVNVDFKDLVASTISSFQVLAKNKGIALILESEGEIGVTKCDPARIEQVLGNLISNALKFGPSGSTVLVILKRVNSKIEVSVCDTGPGITPADLPHIFERFWQSPESKKPGIGLGLSIAKSIVEAHHGKIWAESQPGQGSTFRFRLPQAQSHRSDSRED